MLRSAVLLLAGTALAGAAALPLPPPLPSESPAVEFARYAMRLPLPPPLPVDPPSDQAAPVPDANMQMPDRLGPVGTEFAIRIYPMRQFSTSEGYLPGSAYQSPEERKPLQPPGFLVTVPLR
jgi:hypothetical protein